MKWIIYGSRGWIGQQLVALLQQTGDDELYLLDTRIDNLGQVVRDLDQYQPDRVVNLTGRTHGPGFNTIDYLEQPGKLTENIRDNLFGAVALAKTCHDRKIHYTYFGTGCIFNYDQDHLQPEKSLDSYQGFSEVDLPNFFGSSYSVVKGYTDRLMHMYDDSCLNVRIRMPIINRDHPRNFISKIIRYEKVCSIPNSMTVLDDLLPELIRLIRDGVTGTLNLCNPGVISHNQILDLYRELVDSSFTYQNFTETEMNLILASNRSQNYLDTTRLEKLVPNVQTIHQSVRRVLENWVKE